MVDLEIRVGIASDAKALSLFAMESFRDSFGDLYNPNDLKTFFESNYTEQVQKTELENPDYITLLVVQKRKIVGYSMIRIGNREELIKGPDPAAEIWRFYISKEYIGKGVAKILMNRVIEVVKMCKANVAWLGVGINNQRAHKFYQKFGFRKVGYHDFFVGTTVDRDLVFQLNLY